MPDLMLPDDFASQLIARAALAIGDDLLVGLQLMGYNSGVNGVMVFNHPDCSDDFYFMIQCEFVYWVANSRKFVRLQWTRGIVHWTRDERPEALPVAHSPQETLAMIKELLTIMSSLSGFSQVERFIESHRMFLS